MNQRKQYLLRGFFIVEIALFAGVYFFGAHGLHNVWRLQHENAQAEREIATMQAEVQDLETRVFAWNNHPFYKEKLAREQLQMARPGEIVYYIS